MNAAPRGWEFWAGLAVTLVAVAFVVVPMALSIVVGFTQNAFVGVRSGFTLHWLADVWSDYSGTIWLSLAIALATLACTLVLGIPCAYALVTMQVRWSRLIEEALTLPLAVPGLAIALALIETYGAARGFRSSWTFILCGHVVFTLPFMVRSVGAVMRAIDLRALEEGAATLGAGFVQRFFEVIVPNAMSGILAGSLMVFTLSVGEFNMTWMLHTPYTKTLPVGLADAYASLRIEIGSAYTFIFFVLVVPVLVVLQHLAGSRLLRR